MRSVNLLKLALDAELLRLRAMMARQGRRAAFGLIAMIFALAVLALAEATGWLTLRHRVESIPATLILLAGSGRSEARCASPTDVALELGQRSSGIAPPSWTP